MSINLTDKLDEAIIEIVVMAQQAGVRQTWLASRPRLFERTPRKQ